MMSSLSHQCCSFKPPRFACLPDETKPFRNHINSIGLSALGGYLSLVLYACTWCFHLLNMVMMQQLVSHGRTSPSGTCLMPVYDVEAEGTAPVWLACLSVPTQVWSGSKGAEAVCAERSQVSVLPSARLHHAFLLALHHHSPAASSQTEDNIGRLCCRSEELGLRLHAHKGNGLQEMALLQVSRTRTSFACLQRSRMQGKAGVMREAYAANLRFFRQMCTAAKVKKTVEQAREAIAAGHCVVIGLQSTGEQVGSARRCP